MMKFSRAQVDETPHPIAKALYSDLKSQNHGNLLLQAEKLVRPLHDWLL